MQVWRLLAPYGPTFPAAHMTLTLCTSLHALTALLLQAGFLPVVWVQASRIHMWVKIGCMLCAAYGSSGAR